MKVLMPTHIVEYEYDKNRVTKQTDLSGIQKFTYGNFGEVERVQRTVNAPDGMVYNFDMKYAYDLWGRILFIDYPDNERVVYGYDEGGMLRSVKSTEMDYIKAITYDHYGNRTKVLHGNDVETDYFYSLQQRLRVMTLRRPTQELFMQNRYSYTTNSTISQVKNEVSLADDLDVGGVSDWKYTYDDFNRLKSSNASWEGKREKHSYTLAMTYNNTHGITKKTQTHKVENLYTNQVSNTANYYTGTYQYQNTLKPHTVSKINYVKPGGVSSMLELTYDLNGNVRSKTHTVGNQTSGWHLFWDEQDRLRGALEGGYLQYYVYDAGGERIIKSRGSVQNLTVNGGFVTGMSAVDGYTLYPNGYITLRDGVSTKHYYADSQRIASKIGDEGSTAAMVITDLGSDTAVYEKNVQSMTEQLEEIVGGEDFVVMAVPTNPAECDHLLYDILKRLEGARKFDCIDRINQIRAQEGPCAAIEYYENSDCYISPCEQEYDQWLAFLDEHNKTDCKNYLIIMVEREGMRKCEAIDKMRATTDCFDIPDETLCYLEIIRQYEHCIATNSASLCLACFEEFLSGETTGYCRMLADLRESRCWTDIIPVEPEPEPEYPDVEEPIVEPEVPSTEIDPVIPDEPVIPEQPHISGKIWWYHSDHLGSSSYLTDINGIPTHYYGYLPFGELMVEHNNSNYNNVYKFNGKELDEKTGFYYYGARYYDPVTSIFLSVDPLAEQFPGWNPYHYVHNNPINLIDPTGMSAETYDQDPPKQQSSEPKKLLNIKFYGEDKSLYYDGESFNFGTGGLKVTTEKGTRGDTSLLLDGSGEGEYVNGDPIFQVADVVNKGGGGVDYKSVKGVFSFIGKVIDGISNGMNIGDKVNELSKPSTVEKEKVETMTFTLKGYQNKDLFNRSNEARVRWEKDTVIDVRSFNKLEARNKEDSLYNANKGKR